VERLTLRVVRLRDVDGTLHIIPNGQITTVSNQTRGWSRAVVDVMVAYESDLDRALAVFREEAAEFAADPRWAGLLDGSPEVLGVQQLADRGITIRTLLRTHAGRQWEVARGFRYRIVERLAKERIPIAATPNVAAVRIVGKESVTVAEPETARAGE
jgi:moderate conductance mechanosensitive channel